MINIEQLYADCCNDLKEKKWDYFQVVKDRERFIKHFNSKLLPNMLRGILIPLNKKNKK